MSATAMCQCSYACVLLCARPCLHPACVRAEKRSWLPLAANKRRERGNRNWLTVTFNKPDFLSRVWLSNCILQQCNTLLFFLCSSGPSHCFPLVHVQGSNWIRAFITCFDCSLCDWCCVHNGRSRVADVNQCNKTHLNLSAKEKNNIAESLE